MTSDPVAGRVAVITGASSGIGEATARTLATTGHRVALLARRADRLEALAAELGRGALAIAADVTDRSSMLAAARRVQDEMGGADILVNNAGVMLLGPFSSDQKDEIRQMVEVNLLGAMTATEVFLDQLRDGGGDLVILSSVAAPWPPNSRTTSLTRQRSRQPSSSTRRSRSPPRTSPRSSNSQSRDPAA